MSLGIYLYFNGNCREAVESYAKIFGVETPRIMTFGESPDNPQYPLPDHVKDLVMHAVLTIEGVKIMFSDTFPDYPLPVGKNTRLVITSTDETKIRSWFEQLKEGGTVDMELQKTFWSPCYGEATDKFGIGWQLSLDGGEMAGMPQ